MATGCCQELSCEFQQVGEARNNEGSSGGYSQNQERPMPSLVGCIRRKIRPIESNAKCRHLKKFTWKGTFRQVFICLRPPPLLGFCLGWCRNFVGSESCQKESVKIQQIWSSTQLKPPTPSQPHTSVYSVL